MLNLQKLATQLRISIIKMITKAGSGHPAGSLGMADIFTGLYFGGILKYKPKQPNWSNRDRLVLSAGHLCPLLYVCLAYAKFFSKNKLKTLRQLGSSLQGHPDRFSLPGVEISSGSLAQGFSTACGMALALKLKNQKQLRVFAITSDGEHNEGQTWEAVMFANKYKLNNLINVIDRNKIQIDGSTEEVMPLGDLAQKYRSFGWRTMETDGHNIEKIISTLKQAKLEQDRPIAVIAHTIPGKGVGFMEGRAEWHGKAPSQKEALNAVKELS